MDRLWTETSAKTHWKGLDRISMSFHAGPWACMQFHELKCSSFLCLSSSQEFRSACLSCEDAALHVPYVCLFVRLCSQVETRPTVLTTTTVSLKSIHSSTRYFNFNFNWQAYVRSPKSQIPSTKNCFNHILFISFLEQLVLTIWKTGNYNWTGEAFRHLSVLVKAKQTSEDKLWIFWRLWNGWKWK